jgi:hypothetical protein|tara:strand:+ start:1681 stop:1854 length:174 start_codon:yes stop_codon:yes gene_type:complete
MKMNKEIKNKMWSLLDYATSTLKHYENENTHWKTTLSLARFEAQELLELTKSLDEEE